MPATRGEHIFNRRHNIAGMARSYGVTVHSYSKMGRVVTIND